MYRVFKMRYTCDKCKGYYLSLDYMNELERNEYIENGYFICSDCINKEMESLKWIKKTC